jgi:hypothetical protein
MWDRCEASARAAALGRYPVSSITFKTRWRTVSLMCLCPLTTLETVERETPAFLAISSNVKLDKGCSLIDGTLSEVSFYLFFCRSVNQVVL